MTVILVFVGGAIGSVLRYLTDRLVQARHRSDFPLGTLVVNVVGCFILGVVTAGLARHGASPRLGVLLGTGFCEGLTTFSTFSVEEVQLGRQRRYVSAGLFGVLSLLLGIGAAAIGYQL